MYLRLGLVVLLAALAVDASAQSMGSVPAGELHTARNDAERKLFDKLKCLCGTCAHDLNECTDDCGSGAQRRLEVQKLLDSGTSPDAVMQWEVQKYGAQVERVPPERGGYRLVWLLPCAAVAAGIGLLTRFARRRPRSPVVGDAASSEADRSMEDRLDEELDKLD